MIWTGPLRDAHEPVRRALRSLLDCPEVFRPFVIIESPTRFVQFAGSTERGLLFDVPEFGIVAWPVLDLDEGAKIAILTLREMKLPDHAQVRVTFESTRDRKMGST